MSPGRMIVGVVMALVVTGCGPKNDVPEPTMSALQDAEQYLLLSLDPKHHDMPPPDAFHRWGVLGRTTVADPATRKRLNDALRAGARENDGTVAGCFNPRHGIRAVKGEKWVDLVICFECMSVQVYEDGKQTRGFLVTESPQKVFDEVLKKAGVPLAGEGK